MSIKEGTSVGHSEKDLSDDDELENDTVFVTKLPPLDLAFVDGFDNEIGVRYYENALKESCIVYTMSNIIIIYKFESSITTTSISNIVVHEKKIIDIQIDKNWKIMMSCDAESVFIWDLQNKENIEPIVLRCIHQPFGNDINILIAGISAFGKYLLIASQQISITEPSKEDDLEDVIVDYYILQFWEWSYGRDECDDSKYLPLTYGHMINIRFNCNNDEEKLFALTFPKIVIFGTVLYDKQQNLNFYYPKCNFTRRITETCFLENSRYVISCIKKGDIIIWDDNPLCDKDNNDNITNCVHEKFFYKLLSTSLHDINCIKNFGNYIVTTDTKGDIRFYDYNFLLLYIWQNDITNPHSILSVCPGRALTKNNVSFAVNTYPTDLTLQQNIFVVQEFFIVNSIGEAYLCDIKKKESQKLSFSSSYRLYTDAFYTKPWLFFCLENGVVQIVNYHTKNVICHYNVINRLHPDDLQIPITYCRVSPEENYIGVVLRNYIWMLDPFTLEPTHKNIIKSKYNVLSIIFGQHDYFAIVDVKYAVTVLQYNNGEWVNLIKLLYHHDRVIFLQFLTYNKLDYLISVGADRCYIKYIINDGNITVIQQKRLEQKPKITAVNMYDANELGIDMDEKVLVTANDIYKIVIYNAYTADKLYTFLGPIFDSPIQRIKYIGPRTDDPNSYFIVVSKKTLGVILLPIDGNPYKHSGVLAHHSNTYRIKISCEKNYIILFGDGDSGGYFFRLHRENIWNNYISGGEGLIPFCRLLPGGKNGWLFKEMQNYFFYFQILTNSSDSSAKTKIGEHMKISEISDFMRAIGFFPSEFEIKDLIEEVTRTKYAWQQRPKDINFSDLVKLFINHKPIDGYSIEDILNSIKVVGVTAARFIVIDPIDFTLTMDHLLTILTNKGENIQEIQAMLYILELLKPKKNANICASADTDEQIISKFRKLNDMTFTATEFCEKLLGLKTTCASNDNSISLETDSRMDPSLIYPELENRKLDSDISDDE